MNKELKPCPFCNKTAILIHCNGVFFCRCEYCACESEQSEDKLIARDNWNTRPIESALEHQIERFQSALNDALYSFNRIADVEFIQTNKSIVKNFAFAVAEAKGAIAKIQSIVGS